MFYFRLKCEPHWRNVLEFQFQLTADDGCSSSRPISSLTSQWNRTLFTISSFLPTIIFVSFLFFSIFLPLIFSVVFFPLPSCVSSIPLPVSFSSLIHFLYLYLSASSFSFFLSNFIPSICFYFLIPILPSFFLFAFFFKFLSLFPPFFRSSNLLSPCFSFFYLPFCLPSFSFFVAFPFVFLQSAIFLFYHLFSFPLIFAPPWYFLLTYSFLNPLIIFVLFLLPFSVC